MIPVLITLIFIVGYTAIVFEHNLKLNKAAAALITGVLCWVLYIFNSADKAHVNESLLLHFSEISAILFFLLGAMTIVELIDSHDGFDIITQKISTKRKSTLLLLIVFITFFLSALLDNLTTAIVMTSVCSKILTEPEDRRWFAGMIIIAANAGGAWSPLGDVTTTMLWLGGQITALQIMKVLFLPSLLACIVPTLIVAYRFKGKKFTSLNDASTCTTKEKRDGKIILFTGIGFLIFVPIFKTVTHLPAFMGMLLALGFMWIITTVIHKRKEHELAIKYTVAKALQRIDTPSILFFMGILLAIAAMQAVGILTNLAVYLSNTLVYDYSIGVALGLLSAVVDNVPLVAATQGMYDLHTYPTDHSFWHFLALTSGTGGSMVIIGSAAGVAVMGIEQIDFMWHLKKIGLLALIGFAVGILVYMLEMGV
jgi:Na+/H+ antiporter NhaD/arsenite permease-like protein